MYSEKQRLTCSSQMALGIFLALALILNLFFLLCMKQEYHAISMAHGNVAFNVYRYNSPGINSRLTETMHALQNGSSVLIDFDVVRDTDFGSPDKPFPVNDTIGYGVLLGLLWKVTNSLCFRDMVFLQILMYMLMVYLMYQIGLLLFACEKTAQYATISFLCYIPLVALNVHAVRDVWAAYGLIVLMYVILKFLKISKSFFMLVLGCIFFALCQWIRPALFLAVVTMSGALLAYSFFNRVCIKKIGIIVATLWITNITVFWLPFMHYNKMHYGRYFVSPAGQDLLEGLGEFNNPWGHQLSDEYVSQVIEAKYGSQYGTPQFDDDAKKEFMRAYGEHPSIFWFNIIKRMPMLLFPALPWLFHDESPYALCANRREKLLFLIMRPSLWPDFFMRHLYMRGYVFLGYAGLILLFWQKKYSVLLVISAILLASIAKLPSHIEYRYLTPYYWVLCFSIGYFLCFLREQNDKAEIE